MPIEHAIVLEPVAHKARCSRISRHSRRSSIISAGYATAGVLVILNDALVGASRFLAGRDAAPNTRIIEGQSVKTIESGGPYGYDVGEKSSSRKRHIVTDTDGNPPGAGVAWR